jgi:predicted RecA/RadA family phage recombinase
MSTNYLKPGAVLHYSNAGGAITAGSVVKIGNLIGVALDDIAASTGTGAVAIQGVFTCPKNSAGSGKAIGQGEKVLWDVSANKFDNKDAAPATGDVSVCCVAYAAALTTDTTVDVILNVGVGTVA